MSPGLGAPLVCLIRDEPPLRYLVNRLHEAHGVALVVVERPTGTRTVRGVVRALPEKRRQRADRRAVAAVLEHRFGDRWQALDSDPEVLETPSVNDARVVERLAGMGPVVAVDHGTSIVRPLVLEHATVALNLHWGLSPYYRGVRCTQWALLNWDPLNIGATVHELTQEVDGGAIVGQAYAEVGPRDSAYSINMQLTALGTEIMVAAVARLAAGEALTTTPQDLSRGYLAYGDQWSDDLERHVRRLERDGSVGRMLERPARKTRLRIVTLDG
jgi:methionyl-tRNA formyltransferase